MGVVFLNQPIPVRDQRGHVGLLHVDGVLGLDAFPPPCLVWPKEVQKRLFVPFPLVTPVGQVLICLPDLPTLLDEPLILLNRLLVGEWRDGLYVVCL